MRLWALFWNSPVLLLALTAATWAGHTIVSRSAVGEVGPMTLVTARWAFALGPILYAARRDLAREFAVMRKRWLFVGLMGTLGFTAFNAMFYVAGHHTSALNLSIIQGSIPAFVLIGVRFGIGEKVTGLQAIGAFLTVVGVVAIASHGEWSRLAGLQFNSGDLLLLIACVFYAGYTIGLRRRPDVSGLALLAGMAVAALLTSLPLFAWEVASGGFIWPTGKGLFLMAYAALGVAFMSQIFYMRGVELIGPGRAGVFVNLVPVFGALMAVALLGEPFALYQVVALALVVGGIAVAQRRAAR
ncbi:MAG: DMT family transporter [Hyphomicrobiales bacterium]|nr:DMT family transporter [Hyphomicrobiales bacterium]MBV8662011.1 DMT family transporter [Hyphomicrobiales bacterium]